MENAIYDPATQRTVNGQTIRDPFPNNVIPTNLMDPIAQKIQALIPQAGNPNAVVNNLVLPWANPRFNTIPSIKLDHSLNATTKLSFFYSSTNTKSDKQTANNYEGYPDTITAGRTNSVRSKTWRLNLDKTITPTLLFHLGAGYQTYWFGAIEELSMTRRRNSASRAFRTTACFRPLQAWRRLWAEPKIWYYLVIDKPVPQAVGNRKSELGA
jgi:hypothetical protein